MWPPMGYPAPAPRRTAFGRAMQGPSAVKDDEESAWYRELGAAIREARMTAGITQADLARIIGLTRSSIANIEGGRQVTTPYTVARIHGLLGLELAGLAPDPAERHVHQRALSDRAARLLDRLREVREVANAALSEEPGNADG